MWPWEVDIYDVIFGNTATFIQSPCFVHLPSMAFVSPTSKPVLPYCFLQTVMFCIHVIYVSRSLRLLSQTKDVQTVMFPTIDVSRSKSMAGSSGRDVPTPRLPRPFSTEMQPLIYGDTWF